MTTSYLMHVHSYVWHTKSRLVWITCRCGAESPHFDALAEWRLLVEWANEHGRSKAAA